MVIDGRESEFPPTTQNVKINVKSQLNRHQWLDSMEPIDVNLRIFQYGNPLESRRIMQNTKRVLYHIFRYAHFVVSLPIDSTSANSST